RVYRARLAATAGPALPALIDQASLVPAVDAPSRSGNDVASRSDHRVAPSADGSVWHQSAQHLPFVASAAALGSLLIALASWLTSTPLPTTDAKPSPAPASEIVSAERFKAAAPSILALPFVNLSGDAKQDHIADGITESLTSDLARALPGVLVVS